VSSAVAGRRSDPLSYGRSSCGFQPRLVLSTARARGGIKARDYIVAFIPDWLTSDSTLAQVSP
jgi:hypothetical protein